VFNFKIFNLHILLTIIFISINTFAIAKNNLFTATPPSNKKTSLPQKNTSTNNLNHILGVYSNYNITKYTLQSSIINSPEKYINGSPSNNDNLTTINKNEHISLSFAGIGVEYKYLLDFNTSIGFNVNYSKLLKKQSFTYTSNAMVYNFIQTNSNVNINSGSLYNLGFNGNYSFYKNKTIDLYFIYGLDLNYSTIYVVSSYDYLVANVFDKQIPSSYGEYIKPIDLVAQAYPNLEKEGNQEALALPNGNFNISADTLCVQTLATDLLNGYPEDKTLWPAIPYAAANGLTLNPANSSFKLIESKIIPDADGYKVINIQNNTVKNPTINCKFGDIQNAKKQNSDNKKVAINNFNVAYSLGLGLKVNILYNLGIIFESKFGGAAYNNQSTKLKKIEVDGIPVINNLKQSNSFKFQIGIAYKL
jgi:hypothetical protein